jgi:hypothetical protein
MQGLKQAELPPELWYSILQWVEDVDLQTMKTANRFFHSLCTDPIVWHELKINVHVPRLSNRLFNNARSTRTDLVDRQVLLTYGTRSSLFRQITQGQYINGPTHANLYNIQKRIEKEFKLIKLASHFTKRRHLRKEDLVQKCVQQSHIVTKSSGYNAIILPTQISLQKQFDEIKLKELIKVRPTVDQMDSQKVIKPEYAIASLICPSIKSKIKFYEEKKVE